MKSMLPVRLFLIRCVCLALLMTGLRAADGMPATEAKPTLPRLVDLGADKCIPCKLMVPVLAELSKEYAGQLDVQFIDVWKNPEEGPRYGISIIPTQILYDAKGKELFRHEGFFSKQAILAKWKELGVDLKVSPASKAN